MTKQLPVVLAGTFALYHTFLFFLGGGHPDPLVLIDLPVLFALEWLCPQSALVYTAAYAVSSTLMWAVPGSAIGTVLQQQNASPISLARLAAWTSAVIPPICFTAKVVAGGDMAELTTYVLIPE